MKNLTPEEEYTEIIKSQDLKDLTNTQANFIKFMITHKDELNKLGDLEKIFKQVRNHWKGR